MLQLAMDPSQIVSVQNEHRSRNSSNSHEGRKRSELSEYRSLFPAFLTILLMFWIIFGNFPRFESRFLVRRSTRVFSEGSRGRDR
jgi:hypothetical protein